MVAFRAAIKQTGLNALAERYNEPRPLCGFSLGQDNLAAIASAIAWSSTALVIAAAMGTRVARVTAFCAIANALVTVLTATIIIIIVPIVIVPIVIVPIIIVPIIIVVIIVIVIIVPIVIVPIIIVVHTVIVARPTKSSFRNSHIDINI
jgi:hypothetical protein